MKIPISDVCLCYKRYCPSLKKRICEESIWYKQQHDNLYSYVTGRFLNF